MKKDNVMKKICLLLMCVILLIIFGGCINRQTNYFDEGIFTNEEYKLIVTAIDGDTFDSKNGINVVEDRSVNRKNQYYEVVLYKLGCENESDEELTFNHLTFVTVTTAEPCCYEDQSGNGISTRVTSKGVEYNIYYNGKSIVLGG